MELETNLELSIAERVRKHYSHQRIIKCMEAQDKPDGKEFSLVKHIDLQELLTVNSN